MMGWDWFADYVCCQKAEDQVKRVMKELDDGIVPTRKTIFHTILMPPSEDGEDYQPPPMDHIVDEAFGLTGAASDTTGVVMSTCTFFTLQNPKIRDALVAELAEAFPGADPTARLDYQTLERLPYLTAVIKEGLRCAYGVIHPQPRVVAEDGVVFNGVPIPKGVSAR